MDQGTTETAAPVIGHPGTDCIAAIDLMQFCSTEYSRYSLHKPFRRNGYVYASNGHVLVRVADDPRYEESGLAAERVILGIDEVIFQTAPVVTIPPKRPAKTVICIDCDGRGTVHDCPDCGCECETCDGKGSIIERPKVSTDLCGQIFNLDYVRQIFDLPGVEIASRGKHHPLYFRFNGGVGALMPMRSKYDEHVEIVPRQDSQIT